MELILEQDDGEELKEKKTQLNQAFFSLLPTLSYEKQLIIKGNNIGK